MMQHVVKVSQCNSVNFSSDTVGYNTTEVSIQYNMQGNRNQCSVSTYNLHCIVLYLDIHVFTQQRTSNVVYDKVEKIQTVQI